MSTLVGGWLFRESLTTLSGGKSETVNFSTLGMSGGTEINIYFIAQTMRIEYINPNDFVDVYQSSTGWVRPSYRFIDFGIEPQEVSDEFYNWFIANAVEQDVKCDILEALETTTKNIRDYSNKKNDELKQEIETEINDSLGDKIVLGTKLIDTSIAQVKDVPSDTAKYAGINKIGGMTRKCTNLWDEEWRSGYISAGNGSFSNDPSQICTVNEIPVNANTKYVISSVSGITTNYVICYDADKAFLSGIQYSNGVPFTTPNNTAYIRVNFGQSYGATYKNDIMLNEGSTALPYEPYFEGLRDAKVTEMKSVGVNLIPYPYAMSKTTNTTDGVTWTVLDDGGIKFKGSAIQNLSLYIVSNSTALRMTIKAGTYTISATKCNGVDVIIGVTNFDEYTSLLGVPKTFTITKDSTAYVRVRCRAGTAIDATIYPMLNEGTEALPYTPYTESTLPIPEAVQALDGYGWGVNADCYNYVDLEKKQFVKRVGRVAFGTLNWEYLADTFGGVFRTTLTTMKQNTAASVCSKYQVVESNIANLDKAIYVKNNGNAVHVKDSTYTDAATFKAAMSGVMLYYELTTPEVTDISDLLPEDNFIEVEGNGSITAVNEYGYDVPSEIVFNIKNNEQVNANTFVGDLIGRVHKVREIYKGETTDINRFYRGEVEDI